MKQYQNFLKAILSGNERPDRTGTGTIGIFGYQMRFDLQDGFPLLTTKKVHFKSVLVELLWFLRGDTNIKFLHDHGVTIWDEWADGDGNLGAVYGEQWRNFFGVDQIQNLIDQIKKNPESRRLVVSAWNPAQIESMALPPCHCLFQFYVQGNKLSCQLYQRSADAFLGVPFNIASYALLVHIIAHLTGYEVGEFVHTFGDAHIYKNHLEQVDLLLSREPRPLPKIEILCGQKDISDFQVEDFALVGYDPHPKIKAKVSV